jgi:hypothetical protein
MNVWGSHANIALGAFNRNRVLAKQGPVYERGHGPMESRLALIITSAPFYEPS